MDSKKGHSVGLVLANTAIEGERPWPVLKLRIKLAVPYHDCGLFVMIG